MDASKGIEYTVDATGTHRRIRALHRIGWTAQDIADAAGWANGKAVSLLVRRPRVRRATAETIARVYDQLSMTLGPSIVSRKRAEARGWLPPLAYDDDRMDDPTYRPSRAAVAAPRYRRDVAAEWQHLRASGVSIHQAARQLGVTVGAIEKAMERARGAA